MPLRVLPFLHPTIHTELNSPPIPSFSCSAPVSHLLRCSSLRLHSAPTHLSGFKCEYEWKDAESACDSLFPTSDSDHALISADFIVFSCGGAGRDKADHTGRTDTGDEAMMGKSGRWNTLRNRTVIEWKSACEHVIRVYVYPRFPLSPTVVPPCGSASVWVTHGEVGGSTRRIESLPRTRLFPLHLPEQTF